MAATPVIYGFETSNNIKVRIALGYKGIGYEFRSIDPQDRAEIVRLSGQHLTPVLVHDGRVLFDSAAILRYLDANFPDRPKLFGASRGEQWEIEDLELFARTELAGPMMAVVHRRVAGSTVDDEMLGRCSTAFERATATLVERLGDRQWLVGDQLSAADVTAAAVVFRVRSAGMFPLGPSAAALDSWVGSVLRWDGEARLA